MAAPEQDAARRPVPTMTTTPSDYHGGEQQAGAPVEPDGTPVYYRVPESFAKAGNDGQRLAVGACPGRRNRSRSAQHDTRWSWPVSCSASSARRRSATRSIVRRNGRGRPEAVGPLCPRHAQGRRDDRAARHGHQAVQASRRVQPDQDLPKRSPPIPRPARTKRP